MKAEQGDKEASFAEVAVLRRKVAKLEEEGSRYHRLSDAWRDLWTQYEAIIEAFDVLIYICSQNYELEFMNQKFIERTGFYPLGQKCYKAIYDLEQVCPWCMNERVFQEEKVTWEMLSPKDHHWYYVVDTLIRHPDGTTSKMAMIQDITERKQVEKALQEAEAKYHSIFQNAVEGIFQSTPEGRLLSVNPALAAIYGYDSPEDMISRVMDLGHQVFVDPRQRDEFKHQMKEYEVIRGGEYQVYRKDGSTFRISVNARAVRDEQGTSLIMKDLSRISRSAPQARLIDG